MMTLQRKRIVAVVVTAIMITTYILLNPMQHHWPLQCPFKLITGLQCPGCGNQRALYALLHGHFAEAVHYNFFLIYAGPYALVLVVENLMKDGEWKNKLKSVVENRWVVRFFIVAFFIWLILRNLLKI
jgi:hypothetical protein